MAERLQRIIARAGIASRRKAEELITAGRVTVNGVCVSELGSKADPASDTVCVDGKAVDSKKERQYLVLYKPRGCITTTSDPEGRLTVMDLLGPKASKGLFPVGRLDYNTEGLLLLTDDGDFANRIISARNRIPKTYEVKVSGRPSKEDIQKLRDGIKLDGRILKPESIRLLRFAANPWYEITFVTGRNRQIHRMFERIGFLVEKIRRVRIGTLTLRGLQPRQVRELHGKEVQQLLSPPPLERDSRKDGGPDRRGRPARGSRKRATRGRGARRGRQPKRAGRTGPAKRTRRSARPIGTRGGRSSRRQSSAPRKQSRGRGLKRSGRPRRPPRPRRSTDASSRPRQGTTARAGSPRRSPARSRGRRSSRPGSKARP